MKHYKITLFIVLSIISSTSFINFPNGFSYKTIKIGVTCPTTQMMEYLPNLIGIAENDINIYCQNNGIPYEFQFIIEDCNSQAAIALEKTQEFKSRDIQLIIGHGWTSQCQASLPYANDNDILLFSPSSTNPILSISGDNLFRLCSPDNYQAHVIAKMIWEYGIKAVVVIQIDNSWADNIFSDFNETYHKMGGFVIDRIKYDLDTMDFSSYLEIANRLIESYILQYGVDKVGVELISYSDASDPDIISQAVEYSNLSQLVWFGSDSTANSFPIIEKAFSSARKLGLYCPLTSSDYNDMYYEVEEKFSKATGNKFDIYLANYYDACWIYALSVIKVSTDDALTIKSILSEVSQAYHGASGWCILNENGDRESINYDIWRVDYNEHGEPAWVNVGYFDFITNTIIWESSHIDKTISPSQSTDKDYSIKYEGIVDHWKSKFYSFNVNAGQTVEITATSMGTFSSIDIYIRYNDELISWRVQIDNKESNTIIFLAALSGNYEIQIYGSNIGEPGFFGVEPGNHYKLQINVSYENFKRGNRIGIILNNEHGSLFSSGGVGQFSNSILYIAKNWETTIIQPPYTKDKILGYDVIIVYYNPLYEEDFTRNFNLETISALIDYINKGGSLLIQQFYFNDNLITLLSHFNITLLETQNPTSEIDENDVFWYNHPIFYNINNLSGHFSSKNTHSVNTHNAKEIAFIDNKNSFIVAYHDEGKIVSICAELLNNEHFYNKDNAQLFNNTINWLLNIKNKFISVEMEITVENLYESNQIISFFKHLYQPRSAIWANVEIQISSINPVESVYLKFEGLPDLIELEKSDDDKYVTGLEGYYPLSIKDVRDISWQIVELIAASKGLSLASPPWSTEIPPNPDVYIENILVKFSDGSSSEFESNVRLPTYLDALNEMFPIWSNQGMFTTAMSPVDVLLTNSQGQRIGSIYSNGEFITEVNEIDNSFYSGKDALFEFIYVSKTEDDYLIQINGIEDGDYSICLIKYEGDEVEYSTYKDEIIKNEVHELKMGYENSQLKLSLENKYIVSESQHSNDENAIPFQYLFIGIGFISILFIYWKSKLKQL